MLNERKALDWFSVLLFRDASDGDDNDDDDDDDDEDDEEIYEDMPSFLCRRITLLPLSVFVALNFS